VAAHLNIVVVEDNDDLREALVEVLTGLGHRVLGLSRAEDLVDEGEQAPIDLLVVDLNLPGEDGVSLSRRLRRTQPGLCILMVTARDTLRDKVAGYEAGADIYLTKPVSIEELSAAVQSLGRRLRATRVPPDSQATLSLQVAELRAQGPGGQVELSAVEVALLTALARAPGQRLAYRQLLEIMTPDMEHASLSNLAVRMTRLRKKLCDVGFNGQTLQVIRHEGYQLCLPVQLL
jgi:DNA-binding response OmpR family regulator